MIPDNNSNNIYYSSNDWNEGQALYKLGKYEEAVKAYDKALKIDPNNYEIWNNKGWALHETGKNEEALEAFNQALKIVPDHAYALYGREHSMSNISK